MEDITDADYKHAKKVWKNFEMQNLAYFHDLHAQSDYYYIISCRCIGKRSK